MEYKLHTLKNGLNVLIIDTKSFPTITTLLLVGAGSRYENEKNNGIAHFFEHMAFKGSKKYQNSFVISSAIEGIGGVFNAFTSKDHTGYWIKATSEHFGLVIDVLSDMVLNSLLLEEEINREKGVIIEEMNMYEDTPSRKVNDIFEELLYKGNPLGFDIIGTKETVNSFNRNTFVTYMDSLYRPGNAVLVIAGGLEGKEKDYLKLVEDKFSGWKNAKTTGFEDMKETQKSPQLLLKEKKTEQAHFCLGYRAFSFKDERKTILSVLSAVLGGGMSSRLFIEVRERRGLCYYIYAGRELYHDVGNFVIQAGVTNSAEKVKEAIKVILDECHKIAEGKLTDEEVNRAKELIKGRMLLSLEDSQSVASFFGNKKLLENKIMTPQEVIDQIDKVSREQIAALAKQLFVKETLNTSIIGPFTNKDLSLKDISS